MILTESLNYKLVAWVLKEKMQAFTKWGRSNKNMLFGCIMGDVRYGINFCSNFVLFIYIGKEKQKKCGLSNYDEYNLYTFYDII